MVVQHEMTIRFSSGDVESMQIFAQRLRALLVTFRQGNAIPSDMIHDIDYLGDEYSAFVYEFFHLFE